MSATQMETTSNCKKSKNNEGTKYFILILVHHIMYTKITLLYTKKTSHIHMLPVRDVLLPLQQVVRA